MRTFGSTGTGFQGEIAGGALAAQAKPHVVITPPAAFDRLKPHWRGLADMALTANPFMAPEFIDPAATHLAGRNEMSLAAVFRKHARSEELIGLFALGLPSTGPLSFVRSARPTLWSHPLMTDGTPLLSRDAGDARDAVEALFDALGVVRRGGLRLPSVGADSAAFALIEQVAAARGLSMTNTLRERHSHGLHIMPRDAAFQDDIVLAQEPAPLQAMLEQALAMDTASSILPDQRTLSFIRTAVRGFSHTRQVAMARLDDGRRRAAALAWLTADRAYIWRLFGPDAHTPVVEMALARAIGSATGRTPVAATREPVAGFGMAAYATVTATLAFAS